MKHQMVITFEVPDGTPADEINSLEEDVQGFLNNEVCWKFGIAWTSETEPTYCGNLDHLPKPHKRVWTGSGELERSGYIDPSPQA